MINLLKSKKAYYNSLSIYLSVFASRLSVFLSCCVSMCDVILLSAVKCPRLEAPLNGHLDGNDFSYGSMVRFSCKIGFRLVGSASMRCLEDKTWSGRTPTCTGLTSSNFLLLISNNSIIFFVIIVIVAVVISTRDIAFINIVFTHSIIYYYYYYYFLPEVPWIPQALQKLSGE